jgi:hypothetical protein
LPVTSCRLQVTGYKFQVTGCRGTSYQLQVSRLPFHDLPIADSRLPVAGYGVPAYGSLLDFRCVTHLYAFFFIRLNSHTNAQVCDARDGDSSIPARITGYRFTGFRLHVSQLTQDFELQNGGVSRLPFHDLPTADSRLPTHGCRLPIANCLLSIVYCLLFFSTPIPPSTLSARSCGIQLYTW